MAKRVMPYKDNCWKLGFTEIKDRSGLVRLQCVFYLLVLSNESMKENKLSALVVIKTKYRNRLDAQHDIRCALSMNINPNFEELVKSV